MTHQTRASTARANSAAKANAARLRRAHRKSRNGCIECKRRHIRCDERQPSCANCDFTERTCSYRQPTVTTNTSSGSRVSNHDNSATLVHYRVNPSEDLGQTLVQPSITGLDTGSPEILPSISSMQLGNRANAPTDCHPSFTNASEAISPAIYTPHHMILLRHADAVPNFIGPDRNIVDIAVTHAVDSPYFIDEVLAFTAFHMAHVYPGSAACLRHIATELQTRALASFTRLTETLPKDDQVTEVPRFLFAAILGRHALAETLVHRSCDFHSFIDSFVECFNLNSGVRAVTPPARDFLYNSELQPFLEVILQAERKITLPGSECNPLIHLLDSSDLSEASLEACRQAIHALQLSFDIHRHLHEQEQPEATSVFSVGIETGFVDLLRKLQPEALIILAYYGILMHCCRTYWAFGDAGNSMVRSIAGHLGSYWQEALTWPFHVLETERLT